MFWVVNFLVCQKFASYIVMLSVGLKIGAKEFCSDALMFIKVISHRSNPSTWL